jgi:hypothetical protein
LGSEVGESKLGQFLGSIVLGAKIALDEGGPPRAVDLYGGVTGGVEWKLMLVVTGDGTGDQPLVTIGGAERLEKELNRAGVGGFQSDFEAKAGCRFDGCDRTLPVWAIRGGGGFFGGDGDSGAAALEEAVENGGFVGGMEGGGGVAAGVGVRAAAGCIEIPSGTLVRPEGDLHLAGFPVEILHLGRQDSTTVLEGLPAQVLYMAFAGQFDSLCEDELIEAGQPLVAEQIVADGGGGRHRGECNEESTIVECCDRVLGI